tara:strand:- start:77 stop:733 length:657 start_codon:yes stop_codon:yes gene_type:complete
MKKILIFTLIFLFSCSQAESNQNDDTPVEYLELSADETYGRLANNPVRVGKPLLINFEDMLNSRTLDGEDCELLGETDDKYGNNLGLISENISRKIFLDGPHTEVIFNFEKNHKHKIVNKTAIMKEKLIAINFQAINLSEESRIEEYLSGSEYGYSGYRGETIMLYENNESFLPIKFTLSNNKPVVTNYLKNNPLIFDVMLNLDETFFVIQCQYSFSW